MVDINKIIDEEYEKQLSELESPNIMVVGGTGVGKSTLINTIFGESVATVGNGVPITRGIHRYESDSIPLVIYDTEGYEISKDGNIDNSNFNKEVLSELRNMQKKELKNQIHVIWYCISVANHRITDYDLSNIKELNAISNDKLAVILTHCDKDSLDDNEQGEGAQAIKKVLREKFINLKVFETTNLSDFPLDIEALLNWSIEELPSDSLKRAFISSQTHSLKLKRKEAYKAVKLATIAAGLAATANPLPLSDATVLVPIQVGLSMKIAVIFGFNSMGSHVVSLLKTQIVTLVGKQLAASITKLIPILGNIINGAVATGITGSLGLSLIELYSKAYKYALETGKEPIWSEVFSSENFQSYFEEGVKQWKDKQ